MEVLTAVPAATEIVYALGVQPVAVSHECDFPPPAVETPAVTATQIDPVSSSATVNEQVADAQDDGGVYTVEYEVLRAVDPDLVVTQGLCDVCAIGAGTLGAALEDCETDAEVVRTHPHTLEDVFEEIRTIASVMNRRGHATALIDRLKTGIQTVSRTHASDSSRPTVAVLDWMDPVMVAGHWIPELIELAGGRAVLTERGERSTARDWAEIRKADPDVLVAAPCGFTLESTLEHADALTERPGWSSLDAVQHERVYAMDGDQLVNRPGPRLLETLVQLAGIVQSARVEAVAEELPVNTTATPERLASGPE